MINGVISIAVGVYLLMVLFHLNHSKLAEALSQEAGFLKWGAAIIILQYVAEKSPAQISPIVSGLTGIALMALAVGNDGAGIVNIQKEIERIFK